MTEILFYIAACVFTGAFIASPVAYKLGKIRARREFFGDWRRVNFALVKSKSKVALKPVERGKTNIYEFPVGKNL